MWRGSSFRAAAVWLLLAATAGAQTPVPASANPFADPNNLPLPLKWPSEAPAPILVDTHTIDFDGAPVIEMDLVGPDFRWSIDPLLNWVQAPRGAGESLALVHEANPQVRLSFKLYKAGVLVRDFDAPTLVSYLAAIRSQAPKSFVLFTPFPPDSPGAGHSSVGGFDSVKLNYGFVTGSADKNGKPVVTEYWDYLVNLNSEYTLVIELSGPAALVEWAKPQVDFSLGRGRVMQGLGVTPH
jgi:hypothetical protein